MKTTVNIDDAVMAQLEREAARQGRTMSELVESALRDALRGARRRRPALDPLPTFSGGGGLVDIEDRHALYRAMEGHLAWSSSTSTLPIPRYLAPGS